MVYLFAAYAVLWVLIFIYLSTITLRQRRLEDEMEALRRALERGGQ